MSKIKNTGCLWAFVACGFFWAIAIGVIILLFS